MKTMTVLAVCLLFVAASHGRVGESMEELVLRYGRPLEIQGSKQASEGRFQRDNYVIAVTVRDWRSVSEEFTRRDRRDFTLDEVRRLLADNSSPGAAWTQVSRTTWKQRDRVAMWSQRSLLVEEKGL